MFQVSAGGVVRDEKPVFYLFDAEQSFGVVINDLDNLRHTVVYPCYFHKLRGLKYLFLLSVDVCFQRLKSLFHCLELISNEITEVVVISFSIQKGFFVLFFRFFYNTRNREVFGKPIARFKHIPVEYRPCCAPVAIGKRVYKAYHKVQYTGFDKRVYKGMAISVKESAELRYKHRYFSRIGRRVYYLAIGKINYINIVMGSKSAFFFR